MNKLAFILSLILTLNLHALEPVKLQLKWKNQFQSAGFLVAKEKGFYKDVGLDVEILEYNDNTNILQDLKAEKIHFAVSDSSAIASRMNGSKIKAVLVILQKSPFILMALKSSNINSIKKINGKKIALVNKANGIIIKALLKSNHLDYIEKKASFNLQKLLTKEVDVMTGYLSNEPFVAKEKNIKINIFNPADYGFDGYGDILITSEKLIETNPALVYKMRQATKKGWLYAFENIEEVSHMIYHKYNTLNKSKKALMYEGKKLKALSGYGKNFGNLNLAKLKSIGQLYSFLIKNKYDIQKLKNFQYQPKKLKISLTKTEQEYLNSIKSIPMCYYTTLPPYTMMRNGHPFGVSVDYFREVEKIIDKKFKLIYADSIEKQMTMLYEKRCLTVPLIQTSPQTLPFVVSTIAGGKDNLVLVTKKDEPYIFNMDILNNKKIGINKEYVHLAQYLDENHPQIQYIKLEDDGLAEVASGELFGAIGTSVMMNYTLTKEFKNTLKVMTEYPNSYVEGSIGVHSDEPILLSILNKAIATMPLVTQDEIFDKWIDKKYEKIIDYTLVWQILLIAFILISITLFWNRRLKVEIRKRKVIEESLQITQQNLSNLNGSLKKRVDKEIRKNKNMMEKIKFAQMGEMIANIAHQWRQPLAQVNSSVLIIDIILKKNSFQNEIIQTKLLELEDLTEYMSKTIDNFQNFLNPKNEETTFFLKDLIDKSIAIIQGTLSKNFTMVDIDIDRTFIAKGYLLELQQVLVILLSNANDALQTGKIKNPKISITVEEHTDTYLISISDNAGGVKAEKMETIFEPYYTTKHQSQGIGLYMAKMIIEEGMKGKLSVKNKHLGACFNIEIFKERK